MSMRKKVNTRLVRHAAFLTIPAILLFAITVHVAAQTASAWFSYLAAQGSISGQAQIVSDANASNGSALQFTSGGTGPISLPNPGTWTNVTSNLSGMSSECGNLTIVTQVPGTDKVIAGVAAVGLYASTNGGGSWSALGTGSGSQQVRNRPSNIVFDPNDPNIFWVAGIYGPGIFKTTNGGSTFQRLGNIDHTDSVSVDFTDPNRQTLLAGGHEQSKTVYKSTDGGQNWTNIGGGIGGTGFTTSPYIINSQTYLINSDPSWGGGVAGIYRTTNGGSTWQQVSNVGPTKFMQVGQDGTFYWMSGSGLLRSSDSGQSWTVVGQSAGLQNERSPVILPDGRIAAVGGGRIMVSADKGANWTAVGANFPFSFAAGITYSPSRNAFYSWTWDCGNTVPSNAIQRLQ